MRIGGIRIGGIRNGGIRIGRRRLAAGAALVAVAALVLLAGFLDAAWGRALLAAVGGGILAALGYGYLELRRYRRTAAATHADQLRALRAEVDEAARSAEAGARAVWEYLTHGPAGEPDTFVLYRIIGNDLPPRHRSGQSLENLRFILEHEPDLPGCQKRWVVNRIVDPEVEKGLISLLEGYGQPYLRIPFDGDAFRRVGWRFDAFEVPGFTYRREFDALAPVQRQWALDSVYHDKNRYLMNNNAARNAALRQGRDLAKWILPWDGNCFLTRDAWDQLAAAVTARPYLKYFTVPMARVLDNQILLRPDPDIDPSEEPQLLFRRDAREEFDENARYGRCPKVELFWRLRIHGPWDTWCRGPWDPPRAGLSPEAGQSGAAGWVARLYSGERELERSYENRSWQRSEAVRARIDQVEVGLAAATFGAAAPLGLDGDALARQRERWDAGDPVLVRVVGQLVEAAEREPDGPVADAITVQTLAGYFTREARFLHGGADLLHSRLLTDPLRAGRRGLYHLLDAARLLRREGALDAAGAERLRAWLAEGRAWLRDSEPGRDARAAPYSRGTWYDVEVAAIDAYLGDLDGMLATLRRAHERVGQQFDVEGRQPEELVGNRTLHRYVYNLQGWATLAGFARRVGQDLWSYRTRDGRGLVPALQWLFAHWDRWPFPQIDTIDRDRLVVFARAVPDNVPSPEVALPGPYQARQVFGEYDGVRPFWVLGSETSHQDGDR